MLTGNEIKNHQADDSSTQINVQFEQDTLWLTQSQMTKLFATKPQNAI